MQGTEVSYLVRVVLGAALRSGQQGRDRQSDVPMGGGLAILNLRSSSSWVVNEHLNGQ